MTIHRELNPNAHLFCGLKKNFGRALSRYALYESYNHYKLEVFPKLLQDPDVPAADKNIITELLNKPWNPYIQRHNSLTEKSMILKESQLRQIAGWSMNSRMPQIYLHYFGNESSESLLEAAGIITKDKQANQLGCKQCPQCNESCKIDSRFCPKCRMVLTYDAYNETIEMQHQKDNQIETLMKKQEKVEELIQTLIDSGQLKPINNQ